MILLLDNYDSFVFNLARYLRELGQDTHVVRNDQTTVNAIRRLRPEAIVLSPGPCTPLQAGISIELVQQLWQDVPLLGVCLGHQSIAVAFGGTVSRAPIPVHGQTSLIRHDGQGLFDDLPSPLRVCRYHSLAVDAATLPAELRPTARTDNGILMAVKHASQPVFGVQFHPESVLSQGGHRVLANFLKSAGIRHQPLPKGDTCFPAVEEPQRIPLPLHW